MQNYLKFFLTASVLMLFLGCENGDFIEVDDSLLNKNNSKETVTLGFNLVFTGEYIKQAPDPDKCGSFPPFFNVINQGKGTGTHFGKMKSHFDFCVDITDSSYPNAFEEAYFEDKDGDKLFVYVTGFVIPGRIAGMPSYASSYFVDPFTITGGTGKFEGATGNGYTNDYNSDKDEFSHHHWTGKITLKKKNMMD